MKIKTGDKVKILAGKDRGKEGKVVQVMFNSTKGLYYVVVEGVNLLKKHMRPSKKGAQGQVIELPAPVPASRVMLIDPKSGKPTRVGFKVEGKEKKRIAHVSGEMID